MIELERVVNLRLATEMALDAREHSHLIGPDGVTNFVLCPEDCAATECEQMRSAMPDDGPSLEDALKYAEEYCPGNDMGQIWPEAVIRLAREVRVLQAELARLRAERVEPELEWLRPGPDVTVGTLRERHGRMWRWDGKGWVTPLTSGTATG